MFIQKIPSHPLVFNTQFLQDITSQGTENLKIKWYTDPELLAIVDVFVDMEDRKCFPL